MPHMPLRFMPVPSDAVGVSATPPATTRQEVEAQAASSKPGKTPRGKPNPKARRPSGEAAVSMTKWQVHPGRIAQDMGL